MKKDLIENIDLNLFKDLNKSCQKLVLEYLIENFSIRQASKKLTISYTLFYKLMNKFEIPKPGRKGRSGRKPKII
jgi:transposase